MPCRLSLVMPQDAYLNRTKTLFFLGRIFTIDITSFSFCCSTFSRPTTTKIVVFFGSSLADDFDLHGRCMFTSSKLAGRRILQGFRPEDAAILKTPES